MTTTDNDLLEATIRLARIALEREHRHDALELLDSEAVKHVSLELDGTLRLVADGVELVVIPAGLAVDAADMVASRRAALLN